MARRNESLQRFYEWQEDQRKATKMKTYEMEKNTVRKQMDVESFQRNTIDQAKQQIIKEETDVLQKELDSLEQKNQTISSAKLSGAPLSASTLTDEDRYKKYLKMKNESIFGDNDVSNYAARKQ